MVLAKLLYAVQFYWHQLVTNPVFIKVGAKAIAALLVVLLKIIGTIFVEPSGRKQKKRNGY